MPVINIENFSFMAVATVHVPLASTSASRQLSKQNSVPSFDLAKLTLKRIENWDKSIFLDSGEKQLLTGLRTSDLVWGRCQKKVHKPVQFPSSSMSQYGPHFSKQIAWQSLALLSQQFICHLWLLVQCFKLLAFSVVVLFLFFFLSNQQLTALLNNVQHFYFSCLFIFRII